MSALQNAKAAAPAADVGGGLSAVPDSNTLTNRV